MTSSDRPDAILEIVEEHFEELDFLWEQRENVIFAPDWNLRDLADHEERAEAHLDGLRIARAHAVDLARPTLQGEESGAATAATFVMLAFANSALEEEIIRALESGPPPVREGIRIGLRHSDVSRLAGELHRLASSGELDVRIAATDVLAFHRLPAPDDFSGLLRSVDIDRKHLILPSIGRFGGPWGADDLERAFTEGSPAVQRAALETSARLGMRDLAGVCRRQARTSDTALEFLGVVGGDEDLPLLQASLHSGDPTTAAAALSGLGALGDITAIPWLIEAMADDDVSYQAGAAFIRTLGTDPDIEVDEIPEPEHEMPEGESDFVEMPIPADPEKARAWWDHAEASMERAIRYQGGMPVPDEGLAESFHHLPLQTRLDLFLQGRARNSTSTPDLELEERATKQSQGGSVNGVSQRS